jgi:FXSXX-COOH protein
MREEIEFGGALVDLSGLPLQEVGEFDGSALGEELSGLLAASGVITAGFGSRI